MVRSRKDASSPGIGNFMADKLTPKQEACYYVYALIDPRDGSTFYVGKGKGRRHDDHVREWRCGKGKNHRKLKVIGDIHKAGLAVGVKMLAEGMTEYEAYRRERTEIRIAKTERLTNLAPGVRSRIEIDLDTVNFNLSRFRTPEQFKAAKLRYEGREPTDQEWGWYFESLTWFADLREHLRNQLRSSHGEEIAEGRAA
jgi:hypothetical protein